MATDRQDLMNLAYQIEAGQVLDTTVLDASRLELTFKNSVVIITVESIEEH